MKSTLCSSSIIREGACPSSNFGSGYAGLGSMWSTGLSAGGKRASNAR